MCPPAPASASSALGQYRRWASARICCAFLRASAEGEPRHRLALSVIYGETCRSIRVPTMNDLRPPIETRMPKPGVILSHTSICPVAG